MPEPLRPSLHTSTTIHHDESPPGQYDAPSLSPTATPTPTSSPFTPPTIQRQPLLAGQSYTHHSPLPPTLAIDASIPVVLGVDEAGRGPVLGPMVYGVFYCPLSMHTTLLREQYNFMDSKVLTPVVREELVQKLCQFPTEEAPSGNALYQNCGYATRVMSARDISAGMLRPTGTYNLNAQAMDATIQLIKDVFERGLDVREIYVDTIGQPKTYQDRLQRIFPTTKVVVEKKADSIYPVVSAASVVAKVTRDVGLEVMWEDIKRNRHADGQAGTDGQEQGQEESWGSGYPSDKRTPLWLERNMDPVFGWGNECRFSWGTAKDMLEKGAIRVEWPEEDDGEQEMRVTDFFAERSEEEGDELVNWFGRPAAEAVF